MNRLRLLVSDACWCLSSWLCEAAVWFQPRPIRRVLEADGCELKPAVKIEEYACHLTVDEAAYIVRVQKWYLARSNSAVRA